MTNQIAKWSMAVLGMMLLASAGSAAPRAIQYQVLATKKTSTMEKELNRAGIEGYRFQGTMGGETGWAGSEVVCLMAREVSDAKKPVYEYKLLATSKTSTMQKEMQQAGDLGFLYRGQTVFESTFGGKEVVVILERDKEAPRVACEYKLLATGRTSTLQKEIQPLGEAGFEFVGLTVAETAFGGNELVVILKRPALER
jgi:hypothetical protein